MTGVNFSHPSEKFSAGLESLKQGISPSKVIAKAAIAGGAVLFGVTLGGATGLALSVVALKNGVEKLQSLRKASEAEGKSFTDQLTSMVDTAKRQIESDNKINSQPEIRHDPDAMISYLTARHGSSVVKQVLDRLTNPDRGDVRFNGKDERFSFDRILLDEALARHPSKAEGKARFSRVTADEQGEELPEMDYNEAVQKDITDELVAFVMRKSIKIETSTGGKVTQTYGHMKHNGEGVAVFHEGKTPSAELPNRKKLIM